MAGRFWRTLAPTLFVAALLLTVLAGALPAQPPAQAGDEIEVLRRQASQLSRAGKYAEAIPISQRALMLAEQRFSPVDPKVAPALNDLAYLYFALNCHSEAEPLYRRLLSIHDNDPGRDDGDVWGVLRRLEAVYDAQGRENEAAPLAARARAIESKVSAPYDVGIASQEIITTDLQALATDGLRHNKVRRRRSAEIPDLFRQCRACPTLQRDRHHELAPQVARQQDLDRDHRASPVRRAGNQATHRPGRGARRNLGPGHERRSAIVCDTAVI